MENGSLDMHAGNECTLSMTESSVPSCKIRTLLTDFG